jgi:hypothetical protein
MTNVIGVGLLGGTPTVFLFLLLLLINKREECFFVMYRVFVLYGDGCSSISLDIFVNSCH